MRTTLFEVKEKGKLSARIVRVDHGVSFGTHLVIELYYDDRWWEQAPQYSDCKLGYEQAVRDLFDIIMIGI